MDDAAAALREVLGSFRPDEAVERAERLGRGHIHDTWVARCRRATGEPGRRYVVQRINRRVFPEPELLAANLARVSRHLQAALRARGLADVERRCLVPLTDAAGRSLARDSSGETWRLFPYVEGSYARDAPRSPAEAARAARAFGAFLAELADLPADALAETIAHFHDLPHRLRALERAAVRDASGRAAAVAAELEEVRRAAQRLEAAAESAPDALPRRVVHNDCKINNLLFDDASGEALCVVDLDTVMPGSALFDFGHLVRTGACPAPEDERDLERVGLDLALFRALAAGFLAGTGSLLEPAEVRALASAGPRMALEDAARFLTDHLEGDCYFRVARPGHNLDRARAQLRLARHMLDLQATLRAIVGELAPRRR